MKYLIIVSIFCPMLLWSQANLVPNSSFELSDNYPPMTQIGDQFAPNNANIYGWYNPNTASPDYYSAVNNQLMLQYTLPENLGFIGIATYGVEQPAQYNDAREYISCQLIDTLKENKYYHVSFYSRVGFVYTRFASNNLGVHFSDTALHANDWFYFNLESQVKYFNNEIIDDTSQWTWVSGIYQAHGGEQFVTLGNFVSHS